MKKYLLYIPMSIALIASIGLSTTAVAAGGWFGGCGGANYYSYYNNGNGTYSYFISYNDWRCQNQMP